ncbi:MAG: hypothetical protein A6F71_02095 [Cycloclasticus sp. symbiont of Poecilosclerida sp. M]|nr:MAG: hypothetical protein A6F71_02095 [Cycloclasticus sp. symbiont of Poecilosclerida sp. M]
MRSQLLQVFAKAPILGQVKTRLAVEIGRAKACEVYEALLHHTLQNSVSNSWAGELWCSPDISHESFQQYQSAFGLVLREQQADDLGGRMLFALQAGLENAKKVVLIGTDCPVLTRDYIAAAFEKLDTVDVVFGPVEDGGYVLIACRKTNVALFDGVDWSTKKTLRQNILAIKRCGLTYALLSTLWDVDTPDDYQRWLSGFFNQ